MRRNKDVTRCSLRKLVLDFLLSHGPATTQEVAAALAGRTWPEKAIRKYRHELSKGKAKKVPTTADAVLWGHRRMVGIALASLHYVGLVERLREERRAKWVAIPRAKNLTKKAARRRNNCDRD